MMMTMTMMMMTMTMMMIYSPQNDTAWLDNSDNSPISNMLFFVILPKDCWHFSWSSAAPVERSPFEEFHWLWLLFSLDSTPFSTCGSTLVAQHMDGHINFQQKRACWHGCFHKWRYIHPQSSSTFRIFPNKNPPYFHDYGNHQIEVSKMAARQAPVVIFSDVSRSYSRHELPCGRTSCECSDVENWWGKIQGKRFTL